MSRIVGLCLLSAMLCALTGCSYLFYPSDPSGWGYVHRVGGPKEIGDWALRQTDPTRVRHASLALGSYIHDHRTLEEQQAAVDSFIRIDRKLASGWNFRSPVSDDWVWQQRSRIRNVLHVNANQGIETAARGLLELEPLEGYE